MGKYIKSRINTLSADDLCGYIFKSKSPSCGMSRVPLYSEFGSHKVKHGPGMFANAFINSFPLMPTEDEGRLNDPRIRENFIVRVFSFKRFNNNKNNFKLAVEIIDKNPNIKDYFYTCFYKINYNYFDIFVIAIRSIIYDEKIYVNNINLEQILPNKIKNLSKKNTILNIKTLGLTQNISVWEKKKYIIKI